MTPGNFEEARGDAAAAERTARIDAIRSELLIDAAEMALAIARLDALVKRIQGHLADFAGEEATLIR